MNARVSEVALPPQLAVRFAARRDGRTYVAHQRATHPFHVGRALYRPGDVPGSCTLYSQGCSGGLFEDDRVRLSFAAETGARALVTTAAATIVHRMPRGRHAEQVVTIDAGRDALFEYLPEPSILFPASRLRSTLRVRLELAARVVAFESILQHELPNDTEPFATLETELFIEDSHGRCIARERCCIEGAAWRRADPGLAGHFACLGSVLVLGAGDAPLTPLRAALEAQPGAYGGATRLPEHIGVLARVLAADGVALRAALGACQFAIRAALELPPPRPRPK
jgi:urease accessory protein